MTDKEQTPKKEPVGSIFCPQYCDSPIQIRDRTSLEAARILFEGMADEIEKREPEKPRQTKAGRTKAEPVTEPAPPDDPRDRRIALIKSLKAAIKAGGDERGRAQISHVIQVVEAQGYTRDEVLKTIDSFLKSGEVMEPKTGILKLI